MRKTLQDVAGYLKETLVPETLEAYEVCPAYTENAAQESIREGVLAFRAFLVRLYDTLCIWGNAFDTCKKAAHAYENRTTLSVYYPFIHNVGVLLKNVGYRGVPGDNGQSLSCGGEVFHRKLSVAKNLECLKLLTDCGIGVNGMDLSDKKQDLTKLDGITFTYPENPVMLRGLKAMAIAEIDHGTLVNQDVFLRCDYRVLKQEEPDVLSILRDTVKPLPSPVQEFLMRLHRRCLEQGLTCVAEVKGFHIYIRYCYQRKDVWGINASLNNGYHINVKPTKTEEYTDTVKALSPVLQELIAKGYGCGRKREIGHCDGGCRGLPIPLDNSFLDIRDDIETWFTQEWMCLRRK